jgi:hypothetical protein
MESLRDALNASPTVRQWRPSQVIEGEAEVETTQTKEH